MRYFFLFVMLSFLLLAPVALAEDQTTDTATTSSPSATSPRIERQELKEQRKEAVTTAKQAFKDAKLDAKEAFQQKLATFKDKVKAERVSRINTILASVNKNRTTHMLTDLTKMSDIITKLETYVADLKKDGKDTAAAEQAITDAKTAIDTAKQAVTTQAGKDYTITISSESTVKADAAAAREKLHTDLIAVHQTVVDARQKVANAISTTRSLSGDINNGK